MSDTPTIGQLARAAAEEANAKFEDGDGYVVCPKCGAESGNDWSQCEGACPQSASPFFRADLGEHAAASADRPEPKPLADDNDWMAAAARKLPVVEEPVSAVPRRRLPAVTEEPVVNFPNGGMSVPERRRAPRVEEPVVKTDPVTGKATGKPAKVEPEKVRPGEDGEDGEIGGNAGAHLLAFVERIERLEEEKKTIGDDIKDVYSEAKGNGFDTKIIRRVIATRKKDADKLAEEEEVFDLYMKAIARAGE